MRLADATAFIVLYMVLEWVSYLQPLESAGITPWNPPPGLALAFLVRRGWRFAPAVFLAAFASEFAVRGDSVILARVVAWSSMRAISTAALAAWITRKAPAGPDFHRVRDVTGFAGAVSLTVLVVGAGYVGLLYAFPPVSSLSYGRQLLQFWVGDVIGIFVMTPALLMLGHGLLWRPRAGREILAQAGAVGAILWLLFAVDAEMAPRLFYLLFLPLVWIGVRHGAEGTALGLIPIQFGLIAGVVISGRGPEMVLELQLLMLTLVFTGLYLGASVGEWQRTERALRDRQSELDEALKLAAASETASALAHELNQPLSAIAGYVGASQTMLERPVENRERLEKALAAAGREAARAGDVIRRIREFFRSGAKHVERVRVRELVESSVDALRSAMVSHEITVRIENEAICTVDVDRVQIESVLHQLLQNGIEAITEAHSARRAIVVWTHASDRLVRIEVSDSGPGIDVELGDAIFSPFKTTKDLGTGLGLAIARTIVENHGGKLEYSSSSAGATFVITLPIGESGEKHA